MNLDITNGDVPQLVYRDALACEYAHAHLVELARERGELIG